MTPERLREIGVTLYGEWGWQTRMAESLDVRVTTVQRWVSGAVPIPGPARAALECFLREKQRQKQRHKTT